MTEPRNLWILTRAGASILLLKSFDDEIKEFSQEQGLMPEDLSHVLDLYGGGYAYPTALVAVGAVSWVRGDSWREGVKKVKYVWTSLAVTAAFTSAIKTLSHRQRPNGKGFRAFPSGHTSGSFVVAATLNELYGSRVGIPLYLVAAAVGAQRIHDNKHWLTDVIAGAALGTVIGRGFGAVFRDELEDPSVTLGADERNAVYVNFRFYLD